MKSSDAERSHASAEGTPSAAHRIATRPTEPFGIKQKNARRTRRTVDLSPAQHRGLDIWQRQAADRLGRARVTGQEVLSALVDQLLSDSKLSAQITR
ncbi:MAG: hypothetical protein ACRDTN_19175, partial [Mycobacterium sp.]